MQELTTDLVAQACTIFLRLAYPEGEATIPAGRRGFGALPAGRPLAEVLDETSALRPLSALLRDDRGDAVGFALRLGSAAFPHLKLQVQKLARAGPPTWVFTVNTHDAFSREQPVPPSDHPDAAAWMRLQQANRQLKEQIERAWEQAGLWTLNGLLRKDLEALGP